MPTLARSIVVGALAWPVLLGAALWTRIGHADALWPQIVYQAASYLCHQLPARSFFTAGVQWPVCARCTGLYLAAPIGAIAAAAGLSRRRPLDPVTRWTVVAAVPTVLTLALEWSGVTPPSGAARLITALPLGAMIAYVIVRVTAGDR
jgi:uncharacterized membrane protein